MQYRARPVRADGLCTLASLWRRRGRCCGSGQHDVGTNDAPHESPAGSTYHDASTTATPKIRALTVG